MRMLNLLSQESRRVVIQYTYFWDDIHQMLTYLCVWESLQYSITEWIGGMKSMG